MSLNSTPQPTTGRAYISNISFRCRKKGGYKFVHLDVLNSKMQEVNLHKTTRQFVGQFANLRPKGHISFVE